MYVDVEEFITCIFEIVRGIGILLVNLFILRINSIFQCLPPNVRCLLYVDDFLICNRSRDVRSMEQVLQSYLNSIHTWTDENGSQFSKTKTVCKHFCQQCTLLPDPKLKLYGATIPVADEVVFGPHFRSEANPCPLTRIPETDA